MLNRVITETLLLKNEIGFRHESGVALKDVPRRRQRWEDPERALERKSPSVHIIPFLHVLPTCL